MQLDKIQQGVIKCVADSLSVEVHALKPETILTTELGADSLDIMDIMFLLEEEFGINLEKEDFNFLTKIKMQREEAVVDGVLTTEALKRLKHLLPELDTQARLKPADLGNYLSVSSIVGLVQNQFSSSPA